MINNKDLLIKAILTVAGSLVVLATAWNFNAVASIPDKYVAKEENTKQHERIEDKLEEIRNLIIKLHTERNNNNDDTESYSQ